MSPLPLMWHQICNYHLFNLSRLTHNTPKEDWQNTGNQAVALVNLVGDHGVLNEDVKPENCIVIRTTSDSDTKYKLFLIDFALSRVRRKDDSDDDCFRDKCQCDEDDRLSRYIDTLLYYVRGAYDYIPSHRWGFIGLDNIWRPIELLEAYQRTYGYSAKTYLS